MYFKEREREHEWEEQKERERKSLADSTLRMKLWAGLDPTSLKSQSAETKIQRLN